MSGLVDDGEVHGNQWSDAVSSVDDVGCGDASLVKEKFSGSERSFLLLEISWRNL